MLEIKGVGMEKLVTMLESPDIEVAKLGAHILLKQGREWCRTYLWGIRESRTPDTGEKLEISPKVDGYLEVDGRSILFRMTGLYYLEEEILNKSHYNKKQYGTTTQTLNTAGLPWRATIQGSGQTPQK